MTTKELLELHEVVCTDARELMSRKNHDYSGASGDTPFANFEVVEDLGVCDAEHGILVRLSDKLKRIVNYINSGEFKVKDESFEDTIIDNINYSILLLGLIKSRKQPPSVKVGQSNDDIF